MVLINLNSKNVLRQILCKKTKTASLSQKDAKTMKNRLFRQKNAE